VCTGLSVRAFRKLVRIVAARGGEQTGTGWRWRCRWRIACFTAVYYRTNLTSRKWNGPNSYIITRPATHRPAICTSSPIRMAPRPCLLLGLHQGSCTPSAATPIRMGRFVAACWLVNRGAMVPQRPYSSTSLATMVKARSQVERAGDRRNVMLVSSPQELAGGQVPADSYADGSHRNGEHFNHGTSSSVLTRASGLISCLILIWSPCRGRPREGKELGVGVCSASVRVSALISGFDCPEDDPTT
jgi:hypothetical protein